MYDIDVLDRLPEEPFKVTHNEFEGIGGLVNINPTGFTFWDGSRTIEVSAERYDAAAGNGVIKFTAPALGSTITIKALTLADRKLFLNGETMTDLSQLRETAAELLARSVAA